MVTDTIGDFLTRIRNAQLRGKMEVIMPSSKMVHSISKILKEEGFIKDVSEGKEKGSIKSMIVLKLRYLNNGKPAIRGLKRISKPGVRIYVGYKNIPTILGGLGVTVLTTPKGVMTGVKAKTEKTGGELMCKIW